jgi:Delta7-sterol 5-desaturase
VLLIQFTAHSSLHSHEISLRDFVMDVVLGILDEYLLDDIYAKIFRVLDIPPPDSPTTVKQAWLPLISFFSKDTEPSNTTVGNASYQATQATLWSRDDIRRQILSLSVVTLIGIHTLYFLFAGLSYKFIFNHDMMRHPRFLPNQACLFSQAQSYDQSLT